MLSNLFNQGWQSEDPDKRLRAVAKLRSNTPGDQEVLQNLALQDDHSEVRSAAINKLNDVHVIHQISLSDPNKNAQSVATSRLHFLLGPKSELSEQNYRTLLSKHPQLSSPILKYAPITSLRSELLSTLSMDARCQLINEIEYSETRQAIAQSLESIEHLEQARALLRGKDKNAEKIIKGKLDELHEQQRTAKTNRAVATQICEKVEFLVAHPWQHDDKNKFSVWQGRWEALNFTPGTDLEKRFLVASNELKQKISQQSTALASQENLVQLSSEIHELCKKTACQSLQQLSNEKLTLINTFKKSLDDWNHHSQISTPSQDISDQFLTAERAILQVIDLLNNDQFTLLLEDDLLGGSEAILNTLNRAIEKIHWPYDLGDLEFLQEAKQKLMAFRKQLVENEKQNTRKLDDLHKRIHRLLGSNKRGDLEVAKRELAAVHKAAQQFTGNNKAILDDRLEQASVAVQKMSDWKDFVTAPKYVSLCESMEALTTIEIHPDKLSSRILRLQNEWKELGHAECSDQYWERFKAAGDKAYEPCAVFFKQRREQRARNLKAREPIVEQMKRLLESTKWEESPDYRSIEKQLQSLHSSWQKIKDVERGPGQKQWKRLSQYKSKIYEKLDVVYDLNIEQKHLIVNQTLAMLETEITEESLGKLKLFQSRWKQIGVTRRTQDQAAWKKFKQASDQVYQQIQAIRQTKRAADDEKINSHRTIIRGIQNLANSAEHLGQAEPEFERLKSEYRGLPALPASVAEKVSKGLERDFKRSLEAFNKAQIRIKQAEQDKIVDALVSKAKLCTELEAAVSAGHSNKAIYLRDKLDQIQLSNKTMDKQFARRLAAVNDDDRTQAGETRRKLCIQLEILLGKDSPKQESELRTTIQLERMKNEGLGHLHSRSSDQLNQLKLDWLCLPGAEPKLQKKLDQRFDALINSK